MLFTRCPSCDTTFRVTGEALAKASGQVRCGRCASVFDAYAELRETAAQEDARPATAAAPPADHARTQSAGGFDELSAAALAAQTKLGAQELEPTHDGGENGRSLEHASAESLTAERVHEVLEDDPASLAMTAIWALEHPAEHRRASAWWRTGALLAIIVLVAQGVHHFRGDLAGQPVVGQWVQRAYGMLDAPVTPHWDIEQYQILDWVATAAPKVRSQGVLHIAARIHNRGPNSQPYPYLHLQLKDRWDETVGSRIFGPSEYLAAAPAGNALMPAGDTAQAQLEILDPGQDAYGFELDVCVEAETDELTCGNDEVFL